MGQKIDDSPQSDMHTSEHFKSRQKRRDKVALTGKDSGLDQCRKKLVPRTWNTEAFPTIIKYEGGTIL